MIGKQIHQYKVIEKLGAGGMGDVYLAQDTKLRRNVALKFLPRAYNEDPDFKSRFKREAQATAALNHSNIIGVYDISEYEGQLFMVLEHVDGQTLEELIKSDQINLSKALDLSIQICDGLNAAHQVGVIHRDIKPSNILIKKNAQVKLLDFGLAKMSENSRLTREGSTLGTLQYQSPEQSRGEDVDQRSDIFSFAVVLYEMIAGRAPFAGEYTQATLYAISFEPPEPLSRYKSNVPDELQRIVSKGLEKEVEHRYQSISDLRADLSRVRDEKKNWSALRSAVNQSGAVSMGNQALSGLSLTQKLGAFLAGNIVSSGTRNAILWSTGVALTLLIGGVITVTSLFVQVDTEREKAERATQKAVKGQKFLSEVITSTFPYGYGDKITVLDILDKSSQKLSGTFPDEPDIESELRKSLGRAYSKLGHYDQAEREFRTALALAKNAFGATHENTLELLEDLLLIHQILGASAEILEDTKAIYAALTERNGLFHVKSLQAKASLSSALEANGNISAASQHAKEAFEGLRDRLGSDSSETLVVQSQYAWLLLQTGRVDEAAELASDALARSQRLQGANNVAMQSAKSSLGAVYIVRNEFDSAKALFGNRKAPDSFGIDRTFQGSFDLNSERFQLLVFFETWCPYSRLAMTDLAVASRQYSEYGLNVMGLTRVNRSAVEDEVNDYLDELGVRFGVFKDSGRSWNYFGCGWTPSIRLLFDGFVIWEGQSFTSKVITPQMLEGLALIH